MSHSEPIQLAAIDRLRRLGEGTGEKDLLAQVITRFRREAIRWSREIHSCLDTGNLAVIGEIAHTLRGSASILGAPRLAEICSELEAATQDGDAESCALRLPLFEEALEKVLAALSKVEVECQRATLGR